jgi:hypothetical protein
MNFLPYILLFIKGPREREKRRRREHRWVEQQTRFFFSLVRRKNSRFFSINLSNSNEIPIEFIKKPRLLN